MSTSTKQQIGRYRQYSVNLLKYYRVPSVQKSLSLVLSIFISAIFIMLAIRPTLVAITKLKATIAESEKTLVQLKAKTSALQKARVVWEKIKPMQPEIEASFPVSGPDYQNITKSIEILAKEGGVAITGESLGEALIYSSIIDPYAGQKRTVVEMPYSVTVLGNYPQLATFLEQIFNMSRVFGIESLSMGKDVTKTNTGVTSLSLSLGGKLYYLANEEQLSTILGKK